MTAYICLEHIFDVTCGWEMEIIFDKPLTNFEIWDATFSSIGATDGGGDKVVLRHNQWTGNHESGACTRFNAWYNIAGIPDVTAQFTSYCDGGQFHDSSPNESSEEEDVDPEQLSMLEVEHSWPGGMTANICLENEFKVTCGWEIELKFSKQITNLEIWDAVVMYKSSDETLFILRNVEWSKRHRSGDCRRFNAFYSGLGEPTVEARFVRVCHRRQWTYRGDGDDVDQPDGPTKDPQPADYQVNIESQWNRGTSGEICLFHTANITCGFEAEIIFSPAVRRLEIWTMAVIGEVHTNTEVRYRLINVHGSTSQPDNPTCHRFLARHSRRNTPKNITGHYVRVCDEGEDNTNPNEEGTVPPPTEPPTIPPHTSTASLETPSTTPSASATTPPTTSSPPTSSPTSSSTSNPSSSSSSSSSSTPSTSSATSSTAASSTSSTTASTASPATSGSASAFDYRSALNKSMLFYYVQRSGPINDTIIPWRTEDSAMTDGNDSGRDLVGGWYDAGDHVKFGFPMASSATNLIWGLLQWPDGYQNIGKLDSILEIVKHPLDYFLKCWDNSAQVFYGQVGDGHIDHAIWGRPEDMVLSRPTFQLDVNNGGSDLAGETAAALAAGSMAFRYVSSTYADELLTAAIQLYNFADQHRQEYHNSITNAVDFYRSWSGYQDELCWGAAWLLRATGNEYYRTKVEEVMNSMNQYPNEFSWDSKHIGCIVLMHNMSTGNKKAEYESKITAFLDKWLNFKDGVTKTPCGLAWLAQWGSLRYAANAALIALMAADQGIETTAAREWSEQQIKYMLGANQNHFSYQVGYGNNFPLRPHHQSASCPVGPTATCDWSTFNRPEPNYNELTGALVGGPGSDDSYEDRRNDYIKNEVTTDYNAGFQSVLAGLVSLDVHGELIDATPVCPGP